MRVRLIPRSAHAHAQSDVSGCIALIRPRGVGMPIDGGFAGQPEERAAEITNLVTA